MSAASFSGPWQRSSHRQIVDAVGGVVCEVWSGPCGTDQADRRERLIAAAPEMFEALRKASERILIDRDALYRTHFDHGLGRVDDAGEAGLDEYNEVLRCIDAVIAKATGAAA